MCAFVGNSQRVVLAVGSRDHVKVDCAVYPVLDDAGGCGRVQVDGRVGAEDLAGADASQRVGGFEIARRFVVCDLWRGRPLLC